MILFSVFLGQPSTIDDFQKLKSLNAVIFSNDSERYRYSSLIQASVSSNILLPEGFERVTLITLNLHP